MLRIHLSETKNKLIILALTIIAIVIAVLAWMFPNPLNYGRQQVQDFATKDLKIEQKATGSQNSNVVAGGSVNINSAEVKPTRTQPAERTK
jgi:hypothetical protein